MNSIFLTITTIILLAIELIYFRIADRFNIIDKPNNRSSHSSPVIRGGGIIFLFGALIWFYVSHFEWPWFVLAVLLIGVISFLDDVISWNAKSRFLFQFMGVLLLFYQLWPLHWPIYLILVAAIVCIGTLNAFNFMDGINGLTGIYGVITLSSFVAVHVWILPFTDLNLLLISLISILIFLYFNFREKARCFAGDVGSVTMALILIFILLQLIQTTGNFLWPILFLVYGTDSIGTILHRLKRRENIFKAHRTHLYQYLSNELKIPHRIVSSGYGFIQLLINGILIYCFTIGNSVIPMAVSIFFILLYTSLRILVLNRISTMH